MNGTYHPLWSTTVTYHLISMINLQFSLLNSAQPRTWAQALASTITARACSLLFPPSRLPVLSPTSVPIPCINLMSAQPVDPRRSGPLSLKYSLSSTLSQVCSPDVFVSFKYSSVFLSFFFPFPLTPPPSSIWTPPGKPPRSRMPFLHTPLVSL